MNWFNVPIPRGKTKEHFAHLRSLDYIEKHGWYSNLDPTVEELREEIRARGVEATAAFNSGWTYIACEKAVDA